jgi:lysophospholipase L1-like esterase
MSRPGQLRQLLAAALAAALLVAGTAFADVAKPEPGRDLLPVFARAAQGVPLRVALMGGSIAQAAGPDCWIGAWLREQFPGAVVVTHNAALSAHGSSDNLFRLEREVIAQQPDLVILEHVANDGNTRDNDAVRFMESMIVRLKSLPLPPAIVYVEVAMNEKGTPSRTRLRQRRVSDHYQLFHVDLEVAVAAAVAAGEITWETWSGNGKGTDVHPSPAGHALYGRGIAAALQPFVDLAKRDPAAAQRVAAPALPVPLSSQPLLLDAGMMAPTPDAQWETDTNRSAWYFSQFRYTVKNRGTGSTLCIPFRGTWAGLACPMPSNTDVMALVSVDGAPPVTWFLGGGGIARRIFARDLEPKTHTLTIAVPEGETGAVHIGAITLAGGEHATHELAPQGKHAGAGLLKNYTPDPPLTMPSGGSLDAVFSSPLVLRPTDVIKMADAPDTHTDADCGAILFLAADRENLYLGAKVLDDLACPVTLPVDQLWRGDGLEFWVNKSQFAFGPDEKWAGIRGFRHSGGATGELTALRGTCRRVSSFADDHAMAETFGTDLAKGPGWIMTVAVQWSLFPEIAADKEFRFAFAASVNDNDRGERKIQLNFPAGMAWGNPRSYRTINVPKEENP